jgi:UDPglucose 6-dehydrogenase
MHLAREHGYEPQILDAIHEVNNYQVDAFVGKIEKQLKNLRGKKITVLGLAFKPETDDLRDAPSLKIIDRLIAKGAQITAYDPVAEKTAQKIQKQLTFCNKVYEAIAGADAVVVATEWGEFRDLDLLKVKKLMKKPVIFDGRNIYDPKRMRELGFSYHGVGR